MFGNDYYIQTDGGLIGPFSFDEASERAAQGEGQVVRARPTPVDIDSERALAREAAWMPERYRGTDL